MKMKSFTDYLNEGDQSDDEIEATLKRALKIASEPERGEERKKYQLKKHPGTNQLLKQAAIGHNQYTT